ncbi:zinc finger CCCH domain-containing protein 19-like [Zingiber officinale]|uniref:zinc finger CCCH domain-containing protein 19-like n=1 Tax=Zingiber officinale TaxID=94328 RepID=UPI001C4B4161|nr:zinc finger CCCH domain-containing protein 19-like [Zingiber officinale]
MEPGVGDAPASEVLDPEHNELSPRRPLLVPGDDCGDVVPSDAYETVESHLLGSLFNLTPAFEPTELSCDAFDGEDALPTSAETAADLDGSAVEQAYAFEPVDSVEPIHQDTVGLGVEAAAAPAPVKRKRGRPPKVLGGGRKATVPKKKDEEEVCFICFDGGNLVVCDRRGCPKVYHPACIHRDESFFRPRSRWNCGWHICSICQKAVTYMCYTCTYSVCKACISRANFFSVRGQKGFCETCYKTIMLIESNEEANEEKIRVDFDDKSSWEYLFKVYWLTLKGKVSLTIEELSNARSSWKGSGTCLCKDETFDKLYDANGDQEACSDDSSKHCQNISLRKRVGRGSKRSVDKEHSAKGIEREKEFFSEDNRWASPALLEFVAHMKDGDNSVLSQFDVQALLLKYIKQNNLRDPRKKSQIVCDERLKNLFGKERVGHFEMLKLLESHFLIKEAHQIGTDDNQGAMDSDCGQMDDEEYSNLTNIGSDKRQKNRRRFGEREHQSNLDDYAAIDVHNINLVYLRRNLMEDLIDDAKFTEKVVGSFVRIRIPAAGQKQEMYRLVQVIGTHLVSEKYKVGKKSTDIALDILNLNKMESSSIDAISNQDFTEEECRRLRQSIKCGLIRRLTVGDLLTKVKAIQEVRVKDWLASERMRLSHLRDRASDLGRRKELRECIEKLQILDTPEEHQRRLGEISQIHVDPHMDPTYESPEETYDKEEDRFNRSSVPLSLKRGRNLLSPSRESISSYQLNEATRTLSTDRISNKNHRPEDAADKIAYNHAVKHDATVWNSTQLETKVENSYTAASETVIRSLGVSVSQYGSEHDKVWHYQDPSGKIQGPFSILQLRKWSSTGFFPPDLRVWLASKNQESMLLTDALLKFQTCSQQNSQTANLTQSPSFSGAANSGHNWDMGLRPPLADIQQNDHHSNANQNDVTVSAAGFNVTNVDKQVLQVSNYTEQNRELITQGRVGASTCVWESSADINTWFDQHVSYNIPDPKPSLSPPSSRSPYNSPAYQSIGMQVENAERWSRNQDNRSSWNSIRTRPIIPTGQSPPLSQQSHQVSQLYQQIQSPNNPRSHWENDGYSPPTPTLQPSSSWTSHQAHTMPPSASVTSIHTVRNSWNAIPSAQLHQLGTNTMDTKVSVPLVDAVGGWSPKSSLNALDQYAEPKGWVSESTTPISAADTNLDLGKMDNLSNSSLGNQQKKHLSHPISSSASFRKNSQFFESSCPSPTPSSEEHGSSFPIDDSDSHRDGPTEDVDVQSPVITVPASGSLNRISPCLSAEIDGIQASMKVQAEMTNKITEIERLASLSYESENKQPSLAQTDDKVQNLTPIRRAAYKPDALDNDSVQKSEALTDPKLAPEVTKDQDNLDFFGTNVAFSGNKLDQMETENPEYFSGLAHIDTKGIELASPYTTPTSGPYEWNAAVDSASGKNQSDILVSSVDFLPPLSPTITDMFAEPKSSGNTACEMADDSADNSWEIAPHCPRIGAGAHGAGPGMVSGVIVQEKTNVAWGTAEQTTTETGWTMPTMKNAADTSTCWAKMAVRDSREALNTQGNLNINTGWGAPQKTNPGWEPRMKISSGAESGWVLPGYIHQNENANSSGGTFHGSKSASWSSANIYHENVDLQKRHGGDRYHEGSDSGYSGRYNSQTRNYFGGAGGPARPLRGQGQRGVCKFYESGHCKKGALCNYLHPGE